MNRQSTKKALLIPYILMVLTAIAIVIVGFIFKPLMATFTAIALIIMIVISAVLIKQALSKMAISSPGTTMKISFTKTILS